MKIESNELNLKLYHLRGLSYVKGSGHRVKIPKLDKDLALFLGILWGDGWISKREVAEKKWNWRIGIVEDDIPLIKHFIILTEKVFSIKSKIHDRKTYLEAYFNSRIVYEFLNKIYGFPDGKKIGRLYIPKVIADSNELVSSFLAGVFSTDGKFVVYRDYPRIGVDSATLIFIEDIKNTLIKLKFKPTFYTWNRKKGNKLYGLYLSGFEQVTVFHEKIGFIGEKANKLEHFLANNAPLRPIAP